MKTDFSSCRFVALNLVVGLAFVVSAGVASAEEAATAPTEAAPAAAAPAAGDLTGAAKVGSGVAVEQAVQGGDMKAAGQKGVAAGMDSYMGGSPAAPAPEAAPAAPAAE